MKTIRLFIFDLDGTLVDSLEDITASVNYTLQKLGRPAVPINKVREFVGDGVTMLLSRALGDRQEFLDDAAGIYTVHQSRNLVVRTRLYPGVRETLEKFRAFPMAVVTNKPLALAEPILEHLGVRDFFRVIIGADSGLPLKPEPDAFRKIMADLNVSPRETVVVGDGVTDMRAGRECGTVTCAVTYGFRSEAQLRNEGPDFVIHSFPELAGLFAPVEGGAR
ncbi:MAG: HAD-IA family hydrolase [Nitrospirota bacterium]|nr:HAD-IA family hydrolase [Nitrospirota bacterium]